MTLATKENPGLLMYVTSWCILATGGMDQEPYKRQILPPNSYGVDVSIPTPNVSAGKSGVKQVRSCHLPNEKGCRLLNAKLSTVGCSTALPDGLSKDLHEHCLFTSAFSLHWWSSPVSRMTLCTGSAFLVAAGVAQSQSHVLFSLDCGVSWAEEQKPSSTSGSSLALSSRLVSFVTACLPWKGGNASPSKTCLCTVSQALPRMASCGSRLRPGAGIKDVESRRAGCALDSSAVQMQRHPLHADLPESAFKDAADYGLRGSARELCEGMGLWGPRTLFTRGLLTAGCPWAWDVCRIC